MMAQNSPSEFLTVRQFFLNTNLQMNIMENNSYATPILELIELEAEAAILTASAEESIIDFGE